MKMKKTVVISLFLGMGFIGHANETSDATAKTQYLGFFSPRTRGRMQTIKVEIQTYEILHRGKLPISLDDLANVLRKTDFLDEWWEPIEYHVFEKNNFIIRSSGPDRTMGTEDDIIDGFHDTFVERWKSENPPVAITAGKPKRQNEVWLEGTPTVLTMRIRELMTESTEVNTALLYELYRGLPQAVPSSEPRQMEKTVAFKALAPTLPPFTAKRFALSVLAMEMGAFHSAQLTQQMHYYPKDLISAAVNFLAESFPADPEVIEAFTKYAEDDWESSNIQERFQAPLSRWQSENVKARQEVAVPLGWKAFFREPAKVTEKGVLDERMAQVRELSAEKSEANRRPLANLYESLPPTRISSASDMMVKTNTYIAILQTMPLHMAKMASLAALAEEIGALHAARWEGRDDDYPMDLIVAIADFLANAPPSDYEEHIMPFMTDAFTRYAEDDWLPPAVKDRFQRGLKRD